MDSAVSSMYVTPLMRFRFLLRACALSQCICSRADQHVCVLCTMIFSFLMSPHGASDCPAYMTSCANRLLWIPCVVGPVRPRTVSGMWPSNAKRQVPAEV